MKALAQRADALRKKSRIGETPNLSTTADTSTNIFCVCFFHQDKRLSDYQIMDELSSRRQSSYGRQEHIFHCRLWTSSAFSSRRPTGDCRVWCRLWTSSAFSSRGPLWHYSLWTSSEFSSGIQSSDRLMRGRDLIMWSKGRWEALKKINDLRTDVRTHGHRDRISPVGRFCEK